MRRVGGTSLLMNRRRCGEKKKGREWKKKKAVEELNGACCHDKISALFSSGGERVHG